MSPPGESRARPHPVLLGTLVAVMVAAWSFNFILGKVGLKHLEPLALASFRVVLAALVMLLIYLFYRQRRGRRRLDGKAGHPPMPSARFAREDFKTFARLGLFGVVGNQVCFTVGLSYTTVGHSALIIGLGPIFILILAWVQGLESLTPRKLVGMAVAFGGVVVLAAEHGLSLHSATLRGDLITMTGTLCFALYTVLGKRVASRYDSVSMNAFNYITGGAAILPLALWEAVRLSRGGAWRAVGWQGWAALTYMAVMASVVAYLIYYWALRYMSATRLGATGYLNPVLSTFLGVALLGERLTLHLLVGGGLVVLGVYWIESGREKEMKPSIALSK